MAEKRFFREEYSLQTIIILANMHCYNFYKYFSIACTMIADNTNLEMDEIDNDGNLFRKKKIGRQKV